MKQRIGIAMALLGEPALLILDEPINGLDADGMRIMREILVDITKNYNCTVLISSHLLGELEKKEVYRTTIHLIQSSNHLKISQSLNNRFFLMLRTHWLPTIIRLRLSVADNQNIEITEINNLLYYIKLLIISCYKRLHTCRNAICHQQTVGDALAFVL